ncbi:hypothetical protein SISSUDRAFT_1050409 [Sistotremastrum suecicum HHB10207 ss-3]|uniref:DUF6535 domain-containing protein n=1 Tax=Sistotremastrum suecicum HHB10207 ss-3 TaxID=1314776 RepID=A0A166B6R5_9AGAM|nr:hypothetical protein SISSUDRAFT_1050409 [Sistotremastrum suecicum HHB10207 ss-3]
MAELEPEPQAPPKDVPAATSSDLAPMFGQLLQLVREQNKMMAEQGKTLKEHSTMLETLKTDALKNDQAMEGRSLRDRLTWNVLRKEAVAKTKEKVDEWKDLMQLSLVFNAIFLTVVTAFIAPVIQAFTSSLTNTTSDPSSKPPLPPLSTQLVALFFYLALIVSILNAVLCVLGMQWASRLLAIPLGKDDLERTLAHEKRKALAEGKLLSLMGVLFWTLLLSIGFFIVGLLIQVWALSFSCSKPSFVLIVAAAISTGLSVTILGVILSTTYHAAITENSPFESPLSAAMRPALQWFKSLTKTQENGPNEPVVDIDDENEDRDFDYMVNPILVDKLVKVEEEDTDSVNALKTYARLVLNTTDAEVLERAVPSFEIGEWYSARDKLWDVFLAVRERFLATDTSFRVKETMHKQLVYCRQWSGWADARWRSRDLKGNAITRWCGHQCKNLGQRSRESHRQFFSAWVFFTSLDPNNENLRGYPDASYQESVARVLSSFHSDGELGDRRDVFDSAVKECNSLLEDGRSDDVMLILSRGDRSSLLRSLLRNPHIPWDDGVDGILGRIKEVVAFIISGKEAAVLVELADLKFFSDLSGIGPVGISSDLPVIEFLGSLIPSLPPTFTVPRSFDLTPTLALFLRYQPYIEDSLSAYSETLIYFLDHGGFEHLSSLCPAYDFFQLCIGLPSDDDLERTNRRDRARFYLEQHGALVALPPPSPEELQNLVDALQSYQNDMASEDLEKNCVDAVIECDYLAREGSQAEIKLLFSQVDRISLLGLLIRNPHFSGRQISALIPLVMEGNEPQHIHAASALLANSPPMAPSDGDLPILTFLASLIPFLPPDYNVPPQFDLSRILALFTGRHLNRQTWRKNSDALMHYLHRGAFDALSDQDSVREFLNICANRPYWWMEDWSQDQRTSILTRERAIELKKKLEERDAARAAALYAADDPTDSRRPEEEDKPPSLALRIWDAVTRRLGDIWRWKGNGGVPATADDIEMALRDQGKT